MSTSRPSPFRATHEVAEIKKKRAKSFLDSKQFPALVGFHHRLLADRVQIHVSKKPDGHKEVALKRKNSMSGDISAFTIVDPSLLKSELGNINHLHKFAKEALTRHAKPGLIKTPIKLKVPKHKRQFQYTNHKTAKAEIECKDPFVGNHKTEIDVWNAQRKYKRDEDAKIIGRHSMSLGQLQEAQELFKRKQYMNISSSFNDGLRNCQIDEYALSAQKAKQRIDTFMTNHKKVMKSKKFGKVKHKKPPMSSRRQIFNSSMKNLLLTSSRSSLARSKSAMGSLGSGKSFQVSQDITFDI